MGSLKTKRYSISFKETVKGGPGGYESVYLSSEGESASDVFYAEIKKLKGKLLPAENFSIRQRNGSELVKALKEEKPLGLASGFKPSGAYHFGHKLTSGTVAFLQKNGVQVFMPIADLECDMDVKMSREQYLYWAADNLLDWGANGVNLDASHVYLQSEEKKVSDIAYIVARGLTFDLAVDTYGFNKMTKEFPFLFAGITQVGDILLPQHKEFKNAHSFMVSGQDQDGHMKMTVELARKAFESKIPFQGIQTIPSGFYIPHIRGIIGKASSSKPKSTLYLGSGPFREDLEGRISSSLKKIDNALKYPKLKRHIKKATLDMMRYIDSFNKYNSFDFKVALEMMPRDIREKICASPEEKMAGLVDKYLLEVCHESKQDNIEIIRDSLGTVLREHQQRRERVLKYALQRSNYEDKGGWNVEDNTLEEPEFWEVPLKARVDEKLRNKTQWFDIVSSMKDKLIL